MILVRIECVTDFREGKLEKLTTLTVYEGRERRATYHANLEEIDNFKKTVAALQRGEQP